MLYYNLQAPCATCALQVNFTSYWLYMDCQNGSILIVTHMTVLCYESQCLLHLLLNDF